MANTQMLSNSKQHSNGPFTWLEETENKFALLKKTSACIQVEYNTVETRGNLLNSSTV